MKQQELSAKEYHSIRFTPEHLPQLAKCGPVSASLLSRIKNPLDLIYGVEVKPTAAMDWGNLVDSLWTTPDAFKKDYIVLPEDAPQRPTEAMLNAAKPSPASIQRQEWWASFERQSVGKTVIDKPMFNNATSAASMLDQHPIASSIRSVSRTQVALYGENPLMPGTTAKALIDLLPEGEWSDCLPDLKTTGDISDHAMVQTMHRFEYPMKLAFYSIMAEAAGFGVRKRGILIWQQSSYPYEVKVREIDPKDMELGRMLVLSRLKKLSEIQFRNPEKYFDTALRTISLPDWARTAMVTP